MSRRQDNEDDGPSPLLIFAVLSGIFVMVIMVIFIVVIVIGASALTSSSDTNGPYNTVARPLPKVSTEAVLFPKQLGNFQRKTMTGDLNEFTATYKTDVYQIDISGAQAVSVPLAQAYVNDALEKDTSVSVIKRQMSSDPSYYLGLGKNTVHYIWSHYIWFFNVKANSQAALDEFMKVFKY